MQIVKRKVNNELYEYIGEATIIDNEQEFVEISDYIFNEIQKEKTFYIKDNLEKTKFLYFYHGYIKLENIDKQFNGITNFINYINSLRNKIGIPIYEDDTTLISIIATDEEINLLINNLK